jgi:anti-sigma B factor antagonist
MMAANPSIANLHLIPETEQAASKDKKLTSLLERAEEILRQSFGEDEQTIATSLRGLRRGHLLECPFRRAKGGGRRQAGAQKIGKGVNIMAVNPSIANLMPQPEQVFSNGLRIQTQLRGDVFVFHCQGRLVFGDEGAVLRERIGSMLSGSPSIVVNLREVDHIDSGGIGVLIGLLVSARNRGGDLKLVAPNRHVTDVLQRTNLHTIFKLYTGDDEAVAAFRE